MNTITFACTVSNSSLFDDLALELWLDNDKFFDSNIKKGNTEIVYEFNEDDSDHNLKIILKNKTTDHTTIDSDGNILSDALISIKNITIDTVNIDQLFLEESNYTHDYNGTGDKVTEQFYGQMGCNGIVELKFSTPFYIWLLEHMWV